MQPFRFLDLPDQDRENLRKELDRLVQGGALQEVEEE
jgi:hypothetical protein